MDKKLITAPANSAPEESLAELAKQVNEAHRSVVLAAAEGLKRARVAGELLCRARALLGRSEWGRWLEDNFSGTPRLAQQYMRVAENWEQLEKLERERRASLLYDCSALSLRGAIKLLSSPKPEPNNNHPPEAHAPGPDIREELEKLAERGAEFAAVYADPPWQYQNTITNGAASKHYQTMSFDELSELGELVGSISAERSHLHLWCTNALLPEATELIRRWGFKYKSCCTWVKNRMGTGNYWRSASEHCLLGTRGKLTFDEHSLTSWFSLCPEEERKLKHSEKPEEMRTRIEAVTSSGPLLELFGRSPAPGWVVLGNEVCRGRPPPAESANTSE